MSSLTEEQVNQLLTQLTNNPGQLELFKNALGVKPGSDDKHKVLLNDYTFRRVEKFSGDTGSWQEWTFLLSTTAGSVDKALSKAFDEIKKKADHSKPLTGQTFNRDNNPMEWDSWFPETGDKYSQDLFSVLVMLTSGEANAVVRNVTQKTGGMKCGFAAFYSLCLRFSPRTPVRALQCFAQVVNPPKIKNIRDLPNMIEKWENSASVLLQEHKEELSKKM